MYILDNSTGEKVLLNEYYDYLQSNFQTVKYYYFPTGYYHKYMEIISFVEKEINSKDNVLSKLFAKNSGLYLDKIEETDDRVNVFLDGTNDEEFISKLDYEIDIYPPNFIISGEYANNFYEVLENYVKQFYDDKMVCFKYKNNDQVFYEQNMGMSFEEEYNILKAKKDKGEDIKSCHFPDL